MPGSNSTSAPQPSKPTKPRPDFPLFPHATGYWAKKVRGHMHYFGPWGDPDGAERRWLEEKDALLSGRPAEADKGLSVYQLCAKFLTTKKRDRDAGELSPHTFDDYAKACKLLLKWLGKTKQVTALAPDDFERLKARMGKTWGPVRIGNTINKVRIVFNYGYKNGLIDKPMVYGEGFRRPSKKVLRQHRQSQGPRMFEAAELRLMLDKAKQPLRTMLLLGVQAGFGNNDVANLPLSALDLKGGWINYPRPKTGIDRRIPLWPETVAAIRDWLKKRPTPKDQDRAGPLFLLPKGGDWTNKNNPVSRETAKLMKALDLGSRNFYCCRHTFQTIGDESGDFLAVRRIMGHASNDIADEYRERTSDERLLRVVEFVRRWLFGGKRKQGGHQHG